MTRKLYKFTAPWCQPCKLLAKTVTDLLPQFPGIEVVEVDIEKEPMLANQMGVRSVPTLILDGRVLRSNVSPGLVRAFLAG